MNIMFKKNYVVGLLAGVVGSICLPVVAQNADNLPGGASTLREGHKDWSLTCLVQPEKGKQCTINQQQIHQKSKQRVIAVQLSSTDKQALEGVIITPFGLALSRGATMSIDEGPANTVPFSTCVPSGCLLPVHFDQTQVQALKNGTALNLSVYPQKGEPLAFTISLSGFTSAVGRIAELVQG